MKTKFVLVNHSILDFEVYLEEIQKLLADFKPEVFEIATKYGFNLVKLGKYSDLRRKVVFYNKQLDLQLTVVVKKRWPPEFV